MDSEEKGRRLPGQSSPHVQEPSSQIISNGLSLPLIDNQQRNDTITHYQMPPTDDRIVAPFVPVIPEVGPGLTLDSYVVSNDIHISKKKSILREPHTDFKSQVIAIFMLCSISLGVGVFVLPSIFQQTGVPIGVLMLIGMACMSGFTQLICIECAVIHKARSYEELANRSLGKIGEILLAVFMAISLLTGNCSHIQTVGQLLNELLAWYYNTTSDTLTTTKTIVLYAIMLLFTMPWLFQRSLHGLSGVGTLSVCTVMLTSVSLVLYCIYKICTGTFAQHSDAPDYGFTNLVSLYFWSQTFWKTIPTFAFVFTSILELFPVFSELQHRDPKKAKPAIIISTVICTLIYLCVGVVVVVTYGNNTNANSLTNVPKHMYWITFLCFALVVVITLLYPVINYPMVNAIEKLLNFSNSCKIHAKDIADHQIDHSLLTQSTGTDLSFDEKQIGYFGYIVYYRREVISVIGIFVVIGVDVAVKDLDDLFGLTGSLGLSFICYIFPCIIYIVTKWKESTWYSPKFLTCIVIGTFASAMMIYSTAVIILSLT